MSSCFCDEQRIGRTSFCLPSRPIQPSFQELYTGKSDEELLALAADPASLREDAKSILAEELQRRGLQQPPSNEDVGSRPTSTPRALIFVGALLLNTCIAVVCTPVLQTGLAKMFHPHSLSAVLWKWWGLDFLCAAGVGFSVDRLWRTKQRLGLGFFQLSGSVVLWLSLRRCSTPELPAFRGLLLLTAYMTIGVGSFALLFAVPAVAFAIVAVIAIALVSLF